jgi:YidC/Oxa1 family membrane protein insertase
LQHVINETARTRWSYRVSNNVLCNKKRWSSSVPLKTADASTASSFAPGYIPEPPLPPTVDAGQELVQQLTALGEPTLASLGLASWWPNGLVQSALESIHVGLDVPWWTAIVVTTIGLRIIMFPISVLAQRHTAHMHNHMPVIKALEEKWTKSRSSGNPLEAARTGSKYMEYMKTNKVNPMRSMMFPFAQVPVFLSVFIGIRQMANLPVESMTTGGLLWFTDLTITDPYYALPVLTCVTFLATMELGVDGVRAASLSTTARYVMRAMPVIMLPFIINFPSAMLCYWFTSNVVSLFQVLFLKIGAVKTYFKIPQLITHDQALLKKQKKPFMQSIKDNYKNSKTVISMEDRQREEAVKFKQAGLGAIQKTYDYDPTKVHSKTARSVSK